MLKFTSGNLFESPCEAWVNPVNCVGVMGSGIAAAFKKLFPQMFAEYQDLCKKGEMKIGKMHVWSNQISAEPKFVINFPTKDHYVRPSELYYIVAGLQDLQRVIESYKIHSIAIPALGCGKGGLDWFYVRKLLEDFYHKFPSEIYMEIYYPKE